MTGKKEIPLTDRETNLLKEKVLKKIGEKAYSPSRRDGIEIYRMVFPLGQIDPLAWLQVQSFNPKIYWSDRQENFELAGIGQSDLIYSREETEIISLFRLIRKSLSNGGSGLRYFGGMAFNVHESNDPCWDPFGNFYFILPSFELIRQQGHTSFVINLRFRNQMDFKRQQKVLPAELERINFQNIKKHVEIPGLLSCRHSPDHDRWNSMIAEALNNIERERFEKIVLARQSRMEFNASLDTSAILSGLEQLDPNNIYFALQPEPGICFVCGTPEILYSRQGRDITSVAIAATRPRGSSEHEDKQFEQELMNNPKDLKEHWYVLKSIHDTLQPICHRLTQEGKTSVLKQARVQHLYTKFKGVLKKNINDAFLISNLHPTPAVGGFPTRPALAGLKKLEPFNRGWYAAPVGWIGKQSVKFAVAIRSGLICKNQLILFSGAGIIKGSQPESEWNETNNKIAGYLKVLGISEHIF